MTLFFYIARRFLLTILAAAAVLAAVALLIDAVELIRRIAGKDGIPAGVVIEMALLRAPSLIEKLLPFAVLAGSLLTLLKLTRSQELIVARAAGVSAWQFLTPAVGVVLLLGLFTSVAFNPLAAALLLKYEKVESKYLAGKASLMSVSSSGLWLRQVEDGGGEHIIHALRLSQSDMTFNGLTVFAFDARGIFTERLDAASASLQPGTLVLSQVIRSLPNGSAPETLSSYSLPTTLRMEHIQDSFADPQTISFWKLPGFIEVLENAGFSALRHRLYWHSLLAAPFLYAGMVLIAALFSLRLPRLGRVGALTAAGVATGFALYFFTDVAGALGMAGTLPVALAAWAPAGIILMIGAGTLLHLEDG